MTDQNLKAETFGPIVIFGSGETSLSGQRIFDQLFRQLPESPRVSLLETPAGFELNTHLVIKRVAQFFQQRKFQFLAKSSGAEIGFKNSHGQAGRDG